jgi:hypothetical protein
VGSGFFLNLRIDAASQGVRIPAGVRAPDGTALGGRFVTGGDQAGLRAANSAIAADLQASVVANIQARIKRPGASTNRLVKVTADPENARWSTDRVNVGNVEFLDGSVAKYWRTIESGSAAVWSRPFKGTQLYPKGPGRAPFPVAHGASPGLRTFGGNELPWMDGERYVVKKEIAPMHAYRDAFNEVRPGQRAFTAVNKYLRSIRDLPILGDD